MKLKIYDVAYYTKEYGEIKEITDFCQGLSEYVENKSYSEVINYIRIGPVAAPNELLQKGLWKESNRVWCSSGDASVILRIDYEEYARASIEHKKKLIVEKILLAVKLISKRGKIAYSIFEKDVMEYCKIQGMMENI